MPVGQISCATQAEGDGGIIRVQGDSLTIDGGVVNEEARGEGTDGSIAVAVSDLAIKNNGNINVAAQDGSADAGSVEIEAGQVCNITVDKYT